MSGASPVFIDIPQFADTPFSEHYEHFIRPEVDKMERVRKGVLKRFKVHLAIGLLLIAFPGAAYLGIPALLNLGILLFVFPVVGLIIIALGAMRWKKAVKESAPYKNIFKFFGEDYRYAPDDGIDPGKLQDHFHLLPRWDKHSESDLVTGSFNGCRLKLCQMHLEEEHEDEDIDGSKSTRYTTQFRGLCVLMRMKRSTPVHLVIKDRLLSFSLKQGGGKELIKLEDPVFDRHFKTYATDQVEARVFVTPAFMERLLAVSGQKHIKSLSLAVRGNSLLMMLEDRGGVLFGHSSLFREMTFVEECNNVLRDMGMVFDIIDSLDLDDRVVA